MLIPNVKNKIKWYLIIKILCLGWCVHLLDWTLNDFAFFFNDGFFLNENTNSSNYFSFFFIFKCFSEGSNGFFIVQASLLNPWSGCYSIFDGNILFSFLFSKINWRVVLLLTTKYKCMETSRKLAARGTASTTMNTIST